MCGCLFPVVFVIGRCDVAKRPSPARADLYRLRESARKRRTVAIRVSRSVKVSGAVVVKGKGGN
jgi:hypothetical protein